jgi:hypothetical protein
MYGSDGRKAEGEAGDPGIPQWVKLRKMVARASRPLGS